MSTKSESEAWDRGFAAGADATEAMYAEKDVGKLETLDDIRKLSAEECVARKHEVDAVLSKQK